MLINLLLRLLLLILPGLFFSAGLPLFSVFFERQEKSLDADHDNLSKVVINESLLDINQLE
jgi:hypothetical protein